MLQIRLSGAFLILASFVGASCLILDSGVASAQDIKRSAGTKKAGATSSSQRGRSSMTTRSRSSRGPLLPSEQKGYEYEKEDRSSGSDSSYEDEEDFGSDVAPTLGQACIYGTDDEVVYRPRGARCRGDAPIADAPARRRAAPPAARAEPARAPSSSAYRPPEMRRPNKVKRKTSAGCLYKSDGTILFAPAKSDCLHGIGAPGNAKLESKGSSASADPAEAASPPASAPTSSSTAP